MQPTTSDWPASAAALEAGREFLLDLDGQRVLMTPAVDVDGLSAGVLTARAIERLGGQPSFELAGKGEHIHSPSMLQRLQKHAPEALVVLDMGSRAEPILPELPTLLIDHHPPRGFPPGATVVSSNGHEPVANTSLLAFILSQTAVDITDLDWLSALGTVSALGTDGPFESTHALSRKYGRRNITEAVELLNAPRRAAGHDVETALHVLLRATSPAQIANGEVDGVDRLRLYRAEVASEAARCLRTAPFISGLVALLPFQSTAKVHPLVARRWSLRLANNIVLAANYGYLPDRVNFSLRTMLDVNLVDFLHRLGVPFEGDAAYGHPKATGGSMRFDDFHQLLRKMGFQKPPERPSELAQPV